MKKTVCELFAGVGGFRLGLERSFKDWQTVWFSQWEPGKSKQWAHECYVEHWSDIDENTGIDISHVDKSKIPDHNLIVGGFPCQDYSVARPLSGSSGLKGKKGVLWWQIRDVLQAKKPTFGLFENVDRLLKSPSGQRGRDFGVMLACLAALGYSAEWRVINAAQYGCVQRRKRVFIFVYKNNSNYSKSLKGLTAGEIIDSRGLFAKAFPIEEVNDIDTSIINYKDIPNVSDNFSFNFENSGYMTKGKIYTVRTTPKEVNPIPLKKILVKDAEEKYYINEKDLEKWKYLKGAKKIVRTSTTGHKYTYSEGSIAFPDYLNRPARTMLTSEGTKNRSSHIIKDPITNRYRILTPVETERIQGFDDNWTHNMPERMRYFCMGNALVVPLITKIGYVLSDIFDNETQ